MAAEHPQVVERLLALAEVAREAIGDHDRVDGAGAGAADRLDAEPVVFQQPVQHAPGEGAVGAAALESKGDLSSSHGRRSIRWQTMIASKSTMKKR